MLQNTSIVYLQVFCRRLVRYCLQAFPMSLKLCKCSKLALVSPCIEENSRSNLVNVMQVYGTSIALYTPET